MVSSLTGTSRSSARAVMREMKARPAAWLSLDGENMMGSHMSSPSSSRLVNRGATSGACRAMASPPRGPVPTSTRRRTRPGRSRAISWAISPPMEWPRMSTLVRPRPSMKLAASAARPAMVPGAVPVLLPTPALSNRMISRPGASASAMAGSKLSRLPMKWLVKTSGVPAWVPKRRYAKRVPSTSRNWVGAVVARELIMAGLLLLDAGRRPTVSRAPWPPAGCCASGGGVDGLQDDAGHDAGVGDHRQVRGLHFGDVGVRVLIHGQLQRQRDGVVDGADHGPGRDGLPGRDACGLGEGAGGDRRLVGGQGLGLAGGQAVGHARRERALGDVGVSHACGSTG